MSVMTALAPSPTTAPAKPMCCGSLMIDKEAFCTQIIFQVCTKCHKNNYNQRSHQARTRA